MRKINLDQYFTLPEDAKRFIDKTNELYPFSEYDFVLEPSAGSGAFYNLITSNKVGLDLEPLTDSVIEMDFFDYEPPLFSKILTIGNPPFGRRGSLAKRFFNRCAEFSDVVAFVFPAIFSKPSFQNSLDSNFHLMHSEPVSEFVYPDGTKYKVNCVFQVWKKMPVKRLKHINEKSHPDFEMIHRHISRISQEELQTLAQEYDFAYGQVSHKVQDIGSLKSGSQFIVKDVSSHGNVRGVFETLNFDHLKEYAMGAVSLSRDDVMSEYKKVHQK